MTELYVVYLFFLTRFSPVSDFTLPQLLKSLQQHYTFCSFIRTLMYLALTCSWIYFVLTFNSSSLHKFSRLFEKQFASYSCLMTVRLILVSESSQLICTANELTGFCTSGTLILNGLILKQVLLQNHFYVL